MGKQSIIIAMALAVSSVVQAKVLAAWDLDGTAMNQSSVPVDTVHADMSSSSLFVNTNGAPALEANVGWPDAEGTMVDDWRMASDLAGAISQDSYFSFTLTPDEGKCATYSNLTVRFAVNAGGSGADITFHLLATQTGFTASDSLGTYNVVDAATPNYVPAIYEHTFDLNSSGLAYVSSATEFRIYISGAGNRAAIGHTWSGEPEPDDLVVNGMVALQSFTNMTYVSLSGSHTPPFADWASAANNIQDAINSTTSGGTVLVADGVYDTGSAVTPGYACLNRVVITNNITVRSVNGPEVTIIDGANTIRCAYVDEGTLSGFTITNGRAKNDGDYNFDKSGGGVNGYNRYGGSAIVSNCVISGNEASQANGGGINYCIADNCTITGNSARSGGGGSFSTASNCSFIGNSVWDFGGGMRGGTANHCTFTDNSAKEGGGVGDGTAKNCTFTGNSAYYNGGGMHAGTARNCVFFENSAGKSGGGSFGVTLNNCTLTGNSAQDDGGGAYGEKIKNCIVWYNTSNRGEDNLSYYPSNFVEVHHTCSPSSKITHGVNGCITNEPGLASFDHLAEGSPCIGAGKASDASGEDVDGENWESPPSIGCDEYNAETSGSIDLSLLIPEKVKLNFPVPVKHSVFGFCTNFVVDLGDGTVWSNQIAQAMHKWMATGTYTAQLTAYSPAYPVGISVTQQVEVVDEPLHVSPAGSDANNGLSWATAKQTIQAAVSSAAAYGGTILVTNGAYAESSQIYVGKTVVIRSVNGSEVTVVDGGGTHRCFYLNDPECIIEGFTITNGYTTGDGGGIYCRDILPVISNCIFTGNSCDRRGGGIYYGRLNNCTLSGNSGEQAGGGSYCGILNNCTLSRNSGGYGGGSSQGILNNCTLSKNEGSVGGGSDHGTLNNCTLFGNSASRGGGSHYDVLNNCTVFGNSATDSGGGCFAYGGYSGSGTLNNSIVWGNTAAKYNDSYMYNASHSCSSGILPGENGCITNAPVFVGSTNGDFRLRIDSPCINKGDDSKVSASVDLAGNPRMVGSHVDMGAYEYQAGSSDDSDRDGLMDGWEWDWFGGNVLPEANPDGDESPNSDEFVAGTDPTNAASFFQTTARASEAGFVIEWTAVSGRVYNIYWKRSLTEEFQPLETGIQYPQASYTDTVHSAESSGYYRVVVMRADYDADGDGLPNDWESQYAVADAMADGDGDGADNLSEFIAGTDPTNGASFFAMANSFAEVNGANYFVVEWISIPDRLYSVQWSTNLVDGFQNLESNIEYPQQSYTDTLHNAESESFYRVDVRLK